MAGTVDLADGFRRRSRNVARAVVVRWRESLFGSPMRRASAIGNAAEVAISALRQITPPPSASAKAWRWYSAKTKADSVIRFGAVPVVSSNARKWPRTVGRLTFNLHAMPLGINQAVHSYERISRNS